VPSAQFGNNASAVTSGTSGTTSPAAGTVETWTMASASGFPAVSSAGTPPGQCTIADPLQPAEYILVTNISSLTFTVTRGAWGTAPVAHAAGATFENVASAGDLAQLKTTDWVNAVTQYGADPTGGADATSAIQLALLSFGTAGGTWYGAGGIVYLPAGKYLISNTLIIPTGVTLRGAGPFTTIIVMSTASGVAADMIQTMTYNSAAQAAVLAVTAPSYGLTAGQLANAFFGGARDLCLHGNAWYTTTLGYNHGINVTTNPLNTAAGSDPQFDTTHTWRDLIITACTGDGFYHAGRSAASLINIAAIANNGNGFSPSYDTSMTGCWAGFNDCAGFYFNHGSQNGAGNKSYNNGNGAVWVSGQAYAPGNVVFYGSALYWCILAVTSATVPSSDATHWTQVTSSNTPTGPTSPQAWGNGWYWDSNCSDHNWAGCDSQEDTNNSYYVHGCNTVTFAGGSAQPNYPNTSNPSPYISSVVLDGCTGCNAALGVGTMTATLAYGLRIINGASKNNIIISSDGTESGTHGMTPDSTAIAGSTNNLTYNGQFIFNSVAYLSSTFTSANSASAQSVTGMALALPAGVYRLQGYLPYQGASAAGTAAFGFTFSGTAGTPTVVTWQWNVSTAAVAPLTSATFTTASAASPTLTTSAGAYMEVYGMLAVTAAGTVQLQVTNGTAADFVEVLAGAFLEFFRVA